MNPLVAIVLFVVVVGLTLRRRRRRAADAADRALEAGLGFTIDLIAVVLGSGGTVHQAVATVAAIGPPPVRAGFEAVLHRSAAGVLLVDSLARASVELGPAFHPLVGALVTTEQDGGSLTALLQRLADDAEQAHRWQVETAARRLPVALLPPLVVCLLPAVVIGTVVPLAVVAVRQLEL